MSTVEVLKVVNHNKGLTLRGRYDGEDYVFPPDESVTLPFDAAAHIFGIGNEDKSQALNMLGLLIPGRDTMEDALAKLDQVSFHEGRMTFDDEQLESDSESVADPEQRGNTRGRRKESGGRPPTSQVPGGESAAAGKTAAATNPA
jgi:hypothetical protein